MDKFKIQFYFWVNSAKYGRISLAEKNFGRINFWSKIALG